MQAKEEAKATVNAVPTLQPSQPAQAPTKTLGTRGCNGVFAECHNCVRITPGPVNGRLSASTLYKELNSVIEWRKLAIGLNLDSSEMEKIRRNNPQGIHVCLF